MSEVNHDPSELLATYQPQLPVRPDRLFVVAGRGLDRRTVLVRNFTDNSAVAVVDDPAKLFNPGDLLVSEPDGVYAPLPLSHGTVTTGTTPPSPPQPAATAVDPTRVKEVIDLLHIVADAADVILFERNQREMNKHLADLSDREKALIVQLNHEFQVGTRALLALTFLLSNLEDVAKEVPQPWVKIKIQQVMAMARQTAENKA